MKEFDLEHIQDVIGYVFNEPQNLFTALTHSSYANEFGVESYERFEYLGDSVLDLITARYLFDRYPEKDEGFLTKTRARIVSTKALAPIVEGLDIMQYVRTSAGAIENEVCKSVAVKADIFESILGAILLDSNGIEACKKFVLEKLERILNEDYNALNVSDYKSRLLEYGAHNALEVHFLVTPKNDNPIDGFVAEVYIEGAKYGNGEGSSKKKAEQFAAKETLEMLAITDN